MVTCTIFFKGIYHTFFVPLSSITSYYTEDENKVFFVALNRKPPNIVFYNGFKEDLARDVM
jgi:hypothetical protein